MKKRKEYRRKKVRLRRILLTVTFSFLFIATIAIYLFTQAYTVASNSYSELERGEKSELREKEVEIMNDPVSILLMGVETYSSGGNGRTDSLIVATLNPSDQSVKLLSIPRDTLVDIEGHGQDKINHAFVFGEKDLTISTIENMLDIPIDYYATIGFDGFKYIIDELGGITVDVPFDFSEETDSYPREMLYFTEGQMTLNGQEALAYARMRKQDPRGDFGRGDRQKQIISASLEKLASPSIIFKVDEIAEHISKSVQTNVTVTKALSFQKTYSSLDTTKIEHLSITGSDQYINSIYYFVPDTDSLSNIKAELKQHINQPETVVQ